MDGSSSLHGLLQCGTHHRTHKMYLVNRLTASAWLACKVMVANHTGFFQYALLEKGTESGLLYI